MEEGEATPGDAPFIDEAGAGPVAAPGAPSEEALEAGAAAEAPEGAAKAAREAAAAPAPAAEEAEPLEGQGLLHFMNREELKDCVVRKSADAAAPRFRCHRIVLCAASGYFCERLLTGGEGEIDLPALPDDPEVNQQVDVEAMFPLILRYAYSDQRWESIEVDVGPENAMGLYVLAAALKMPSLASKAFELVASFSVSPQSAVRLLYTAARLCAGLAGFEQALALCIEETKHCFAEACSSSVEDMRLFCQLPVEILVSILDADDLEVPMEGTVLECARSVLQARVPPEGAEREEGDGGAIWAAPFCGDEPRRVLNTVRFPHLEHDQLLMASQDPVLMQAGAQEQVLQALSARLGRYEQVDSEILPARPPRPSTVGASRKTTSRAVKPAVESVRVAADGIENWLPSAVLDVRSGSVVASPEEPLFFQRRSSDFDEGGALYWLGTNGRTHTWRNPVGLGHVVPISSGVGCGKLEDIVWRVAVNLRSCNSPGSYFGVDLKLDRLLVLQGYCLRNRNMTSHVLMSWICQGSLDGENWETLDSRNSESSLRKAGATAYFQVQHEDEQRGFRFFRVLQEGVNSSGSHNLVLSGIELYGYAVGGTWP